MTLALQIVVLLVVVVGLITTIMTVKHWHWAQMLLLLGIFFSSIGTLLLGMEVFRIHRNIRKGIPALEARLAAVEEESAAITQGTRDSALANRVFAPEEVPFDLEAEGRMPSRDVWTNRLQVMARQRGRVWRDVRPAGALDPRTGQLLVTIAQPKPHGLEKDAIVYAFEQGPPNAAAPDQGPQYLGEFRVIEANADGAKLESVRRLDNITGNRLARSQGPWSLYETMPADSHELFAKFNEEQLNQMLPAASVKEYLRHGTPATEDDDAFHRAYFDDQGRRLGPENEAQAVETHYDRELRDYAFLFGELIRQRVVKLADRDALKVDIAALKAADANAKKLTAHRTKEKELLGADFVWIKRELAFIEKLRDTVQQQLANARQQVADLLQKNSQDAERYIQEQLAQLEAIDSVAPVPPNSSSLLNSTP